MPGGLAARACPVSLEVLLRVVVGRYTCFAAIVRRSGHFFLLTFRTPHGGNDGGSVQGVSS